MIRRFESEFTEPGDHIVEGGRVWQQALPYLRKGWLIKTPLTCDARPVFDATGKRTGVKYKIFIVISDTEGDKPERKALQ